MTDASRDLGALSGPLAGAAAAGAPAKATLLSLVLTADGKREATDVALHRDIFLAGGLRYMASFGIFAGRLPEPLSTVGLAAVGGGGTEPAEPHHQARGVAHPAGHTSGLVVPGVAGVLLGRSGRAGRESP